MAPRFAEMIEADLAIMHKTRPRTTVARSPRSPAASATRSRSSATT
jgi:hypothetical protein